MKEETKAKRLALMELSTKVQPLVERGIYGTINAAIVNEFYKKEGNKEFMTFEQWKDKGFRVKKGEKAFLVWAKPLDALKQEKQGEEAPETEEQGKFFPLCHLFSNLQVRRAGE